jgi:hypothetical protein
MTASRPFEEAELPEEIGASVVEQASDGIKRAAHGVGVGYEQARKPGMPLSILSNIARETPFGSLPAKIVLLDQLGPDAVNRQCPRPEDRRLER